MTRRTTLEGRTLGPWMVLALLTAALVGPGTTPAAADTSSRQLRPDGVVAPFAVTPIDATAATALADPVTQPASVPSASYIHASGAGRSTTITLATTTLSGTPTTSQAWFYANTGTSTRMKVDLVWGGDTHASTTVAAGAGFAWRSIAFTPPSQAAVDDLQLRFTTLAGTDTNIRAAYVALSSTTCSGYGSFGSGAWPQACWRPFTPSSPFNTPLPSVQSFLEAHSQPAVSGPVKHAKVGNFAADPAGGGGEPVYYSRDSDPEFELACIHDEYSRPDHSCPIDGMSIKIPAGARPEENRATVVSPEERHDAHLIVIDQTGGWEYDLWQVQSTSSFMSTSDGGTTVLKGLSPNGGKVNFSWGGRVRLSSDGSASLPADGAADDANAAHWAETAGRVRAEELAAGHIDHALFLNLPCTANVPSVYPADPSGRALPCTSTKVGELGAHPLGSRYWLDMSSAQIDALPVPTWKKTFLHALATYGGFVGDTNDDTDTLFFIEIEGGTMYSSLNDSSGQPYPDRWYQFASDNQWPVCTAADCLPGVRVGKLYAEAPIDTYDWATNIWSRLRFVDPCITPAPGAPGCS